jgi:hypothetical protein
MPDTYPAHYAPAFMRGWHAGQEKLAWALSEAGTNPERKDTGMQAQPIAPANDEGDDDQQEAA